MYRISVLALVLCIASCSAAATEGQDFSHGFQILGKAVRHYLNSQLDDVKLGEGVHLINTRSPNDARSHSDDGTILGAFENYLQNHEIKIKLPELMPEQGFGRAFKDAMEGFDANDNGIYYSIAILKQKSTFSINFNWSGSLFCEEINILNVSNHF